MTKKFEFGRVYFTFGFSDTDFIFPVIEPIIYQEFDVENEIWIFQEAESFNNNKLDYLKNMNELIGDDITPDKIAKFSSSDVNIYSYEEDLLNTIMTSQELSKKLLDYSNTEHLVNPFLKKLSSKQP